jgi:predicted transglutaminase-like cysteine proteinase
MLRPLIALLALGFAAAALAQPAPTPQVQTQQQTSPPAAAKPAAKPAAKTAQAPKKVRPTWAELTPAQQEVLAALKPEWDNLDRDRRLKWVGIEALSGDAAGAAGACSAAWKPG